MKRSRAFLGCILFICIMAGCGKQVMWVTSVSDVYLLRTEGIDIKQSEAMVVLNELLMLNMDSAVAEEQIKKTDLETELTVLLVMNAIAKEQKIALEQQDIQNTQTVGKQFYQKVKDSGKYPGLTEEIAIDLAAKYRIAELAIEHYAGTVKTEISDNEKRVLHLQIIFVTDAGEAELVHQKAEEGENFVSLGQSYNRMDTFEFYVARNELQPELEKAAYALSKGEISPVIHTTSGYYIIRCMNNFDQALSQSNEAVILQELKLSAWISTYNEYVLGHEIYRNEEVWESLTIRDDEDNNTSSFFQMYHRYFDE